ncbi:hypothetical protein ON003_03560 [Janibacter hoylei]|uniref:hypothetical protein n=1 Tax=Janibacter hoylei TaxID=364298 RepID=UPI00223834B5|nr:hypothetical protein [Janibacter hoylei]MCW4600783.1 hypothetical protein [Janibacter hoylei]
METLRSRWHADVTALCPTALPERVAGEVTDLLDRWLEDHRSYHDAVHLAEVLAALDELHEGVTSPPSTGTSQGWSPGTTTPCTTRRPRRGPTRRRLRCSPRSGSPRSACRPSAWRTWRPWCATARPTR